MKVNISSSTGFDVVCFGQLGSKVDARNMVKLDAFISNDAQEGGVVSRLMQGEWGGGLVGVKRGKTRKTRDSSAPLQTQAANGTFHDGFVGVVGAGPGIAMGL